MASKFWSILRKLIEWLTPPALLHDPMKAQVAQRLVAVHLGIFAAPLAFAVIYYALDAPVCAVTALIGCAFVVVNL